MVANQPTFRCTPTIRDVSRVRWLNSPSNTPLQANYWIQTLTPLLNAALGYERQLLAREPYKVEQLLAGCPALCFIIDSPERRIQRLKDRDGTDNQQQEERYNEALEA